MNEVGATLVILLVSTLLWAHVALAGPLDIGTTSGIITHSMDHNKLLEKNSESYEMNTVVGQQAESPNSIRSEMNEMVTTEEHTKQEAKNTTKAAKETTEKMGEKSQNMANAAVTSTGNKGDGAKYKPSAHVAVAIPRRFAEENTIKEMESKGMAKCKGDSCIIMVDKNAAEKHIAHILSAVLKRVSSRAKVHTAIIRRGDYAVAKAVVEDVNKTEVSYATADQGIFAVTVENNQIAVARFVIKKALDLNTTDRIEFASCSIGVRNVNYDPSNGTISFQMSDGNQPVYIPSVKIVGPGTLVLPQYDSETKRYAAKIKNPAGAKIEAYVDGCGEIIYPLTEGQTSSRENKDKKDHER